MNDQFGLESNFRFAVSPGTLKSMQGIISQLQGIEKSIRETSKTAGKQNLGRNIEKSVSGANAGAKDGAAAAKKNLSALKAEFRALKATAANIDYGSALETGKFKSATKAVKEYTRSLEEMRAKIEGNSDAEREFSEVLKRQQRVATDKLSMHGHQNEAARSAQRVGEFGALRDAGKAVLTPATDFAKEAINIYGSFDDKMAGVAAVSRASGKEMDVLRKKAFALGASTRYTAAEAADAEGFLSSAGFNTEQILTGVGATLDLASAGALDLGAAADISSNVLSGMGLKVDDLTHVVDTLALVAADANTNIQQMGVAMSYAAPNAALFGASIEETAALMGTMSNSGIQADKAGTAMRGAFLRLAAPTSAGTAALKQYDIALQDTHGNMRNVMDVMNDMARNLHLDKSLVKGILDAGDDEHKINAAVNTALNDATRRAKEATDDATAQAEITKAQQIKALKDIFGTTGISGAAAALGSMEEANRMALAGLADSTSTKQIEKKLNAKFGISKGTDDKDIFAATFAKAGKDYTTAAGIISQAVISVTEDNLKKLNNGQIEQIREKLQIPPGQDILSTLQANSPDANSALSKLTSAMSQLNIEFKGVTGAGKQMAQTMENSLPGSFRSLSSAVEAVYISLIEPLAPFIRFVADIATKFSLFIANLPGPIRVGIATTAALLIGVAAVSVAIGQAGMTLFGFSQALATASAASTALSAGLIPLTGFFSTSMGAFIGTNPLDTFLGKGAMTAVKDFKLAFTGTSKEVMTWGEGMIATITRVGKATLVMGRTFAFSPVMMWVGAIMLLNGLLARVAPEFNIIGTGLSVIGSAAGFLVGLFEGVVAGLGDLLGFPAGELGNALSAPFRVISNAVDMMITSFQAWEESGQEIGKSITKMVGAPFVTVATIINAVWTGALDAIANKLKPFADTIEYMGKWLQGTLEEPADKVGGAWGSAVSGILGNWNWLASQASGIRDVIVGMLNHGSADATLMAWERVSVAISSIWLLMTGHATITGTAISEVFKFAWGLIIAVAIQGTSAISNAWTSAVNGIAVAWNWLVSQAVGIRDSIVNLLNHGSADATLSAWERVSAAISSAWNWMVDKASAAGNAISGAFIEGFVWASDKINLLPGQMIDGFVWAADQINAAWTSSVNAIASGWNWLTGKATTAGDATIGAVTEASVTAADKVNLGFTTVQTQASAAGIATSNALNTAFVSVTDASTFTTDKVNAGLSAVQVQASAAGTATTTALNTAFTSVTEVSTLATEKVNAGLTSVQTQAIAAGTATTTAWEQVKSSIAAGWTWLGQQIENVKTAIANDGIAKTIGNGILQAIGWTLAQIINLSVRIFLVGMIAIVDIIDVYTTIILAIETGISRALNALAGVLVEGMVWAVDKLNALPGQLIEGFVWAADRVDNAWANTVNGIVGAWNWLVSQARGIRDSIVGFLNHGSADATLSAWDRVSLAISSTWNWMVEQASAAGTAIATAFGSAFNFLGSQITNISGAITGLGMIPVMAWGGPQQILDGWNQITQKKPEVLGPALPDSPTKTAPQAAEPAKTAWDEFTGGAQTVAQAIEEANKTKNIFQKMWDGISSFAMPYINEFVYQATASFEQLHTSINETLDNTFGKGTSDLFQGIFDFWASVGTNITTTLGTFFSRVSEIWQSDANAIEKTFQFIGSIVTAFFSLLTISPMLKDAETGWLHGAVEQFNMLGFAVLTASSMLMNLQTLLAETAGSIVPALGGLTEEGIPKGVSLMLPGAVAMMMRNGVFTGISEGFMQWVNEAPQKIQDFIPKLYEAPTAKAFLEGMGIQQQAMSDFFMSMTADGRQALYQKRVDAGMTPGMPANSAEYDIQKKVYEDQKKAFKAGKITEQPVPPQAPANAEGVVEWLNGVAEAVRNLETKIKPIFETFATTTGPDFVGMMLKPITDIFNATDAFKEKLEGVENIPGFGIPLMEFVVVHKFLDGLASFLESPSFKGLGAFLSGPVREALVAVGGALFGIGRAISALFAGIPYFILQQAIKNARAAAIAAGEGAKSAKNIAEAAGQVALNVLGQAEQVAEKAALSFLEQTITWLRQVPYIGNALADGLLFAARTFSTLYKLLKQLGELIVQALPSYIEFAKKTGIELLESLKPLTPAFQRVFQALGAGALYFYNKGMLPLFEMLGFLMPNKLLALYIQTKGFQGILRGGILNGINVFDVFLGTFGKGLNQSIRLVRLFQNELFPTNILEAKMKDITYILANREQKLAFERLGKSFVLDGPLAQMFRLTALISPLIQIMGRFALTWMFWFSILEPITPEMFKTLHALADWIGAIDRSNQALQSVSWTLHKFIDFIWTLRKIYVEIIPTIFKVIVAYYQTFRLIGKMVKPAAMLITAALLIAYRVAKFAMSALAIAVLTPIVMVTTTLQGFVLFLERIGNNFRRFQSETIVGWLRFRGLLTSLLGDKGNVSIWLNIFGLIGDAIKDHLRAITTVLLFATGQGFAMAALWGLTMFISALMDGKKKIIPAAQAIGKAIVEGVVNAKADLDRAMIKLLNSMSKGFEKVANHFGQTSEQLAATLMMYATIAAFLGATIWLALMQGGKPGMTGNQTALMNLGKALNFVTMSSTGTATSVRLLRLAFLGLGIGVIALVVWDAFHGFTYLHKIMNALQQPMEWLKGAFRSLISSVTDPVPFWLVGVVGSIAEKFVQFLPILLAGLFLAGVVIKKSLGGGLEFIIERVAAVVGGIMNIVRGIRTLPQAYARAEAPALEAIHKGRSKLGLYKNKSVEAAREREYKLAKDANKFRDAITFGKIETSIKTLAKTQKATHGHLVETVNVKKGGFMGIGAKVQEETRLTEFGLQYRDKQLAEGIREKTGMFTDDAITKLAKSMSPERLGKLTGDQLRQLYAEGRPDLQTLSEALELLDVNSITSKNLNVQNLNVQNGTGANGQSLPPGQRLAAAVAKMQEHQMNNPGASFIDVATLEGAFQSDGSHEILKRGAVRPVDTSAANFIAGADTFDSHPQIQEFIRTNAATFSSSINSQLGGTAVGSTPSPGLEAMRKTILAQLIEAQLQSVNGVAGQATAAGEAISGEITKIQLPIRTGLFGVIADTLDSTYNAIKRTAGKFSRQALSTNQKTSQEIIKKRDTLINSLLVANPIADKKQRDKLDEIRNQLRNASLDAKTQSTKMRIIARMINADPYRLENVHRNFMDVGREIAKATAMRKSKFDAILNDRKTPSGQSRSDKFKKFKSELDKDQLKALEEGRFRALGVYKRKNEKGQEIEAPRAELLAAILGYGRDGLAKFEQDFSTASFIEAQKVTLLGKIKRFAGIRSKEDNLEGQLQGLRRTLNEDLRREFRAQKKRDEANRETSEARRRGLNAHLKSIGWSQSKFLGELHHGQNALFERFLRTGSFKRQTPQEDLVAMAETMGFEGKHAVDDFMKFRAKLTEEQKAVLTAYTGNNQRLNADGINFAGKTDKYSQGDAHKTLNKIIAQIWEMQGDKGGDISDFQNRVKDEIQKARTRQGSAGDQTIAKMLEDYIATGNREFNVADKEIAAIGRILKLDPGGMTDAEVANLVKGIANLQQTGGIFYPLKKAIQNMQDWFVQQASGLDQNVNFLLKWIGTLSVGSFNFFGVPRMIEKALRTTIYNPIRNMMISIWEIPGAIQEDITNKAKELANRAKNKFHRLPGVRAFTGAGEDEQRKRSLPVMLKNVGLSQGNAFKSNTYQEEFFKNLANQQNVPTDPGEFDKFKYKAWAAISNPGKMGIKSKILGNPDLAAMQTQIELAFGETLKLQAHQVTDAFAAGGLNKRGAFTGLGAKRRQQAEVSLPSMIEQAGMSSGAEFEERFTQELKTAGIRERQAILKSIEAVLSVSDEGLGHALQNATDEVVRDNHDKIKEALARTLKISEQGKINKMMEAGGLTTKAVEPWAVLIAKTIIPAMWDLTKGIARVIPSTVSKSIDAVRNFRQTLDNVFGGLNRTFLWVGNAAMKLFRGPKQRDFEKRTENIRKQQERVEAVEVLKADPNALRKYGQSNVAINKMAEITPKMEQKRQEIAEIQAAIAGLDAKIKKKEIQIAEQERAHETAEAALAAARANPHADPREQAKIITDLTANKRAVEISMNSLTAELTALDAQANKEKAKLPGLQDKFERYKEVMKQLSDRANINTSLPKKSIEALQKLPKDMLDRMLKNGVTGIEQELQRQSKNFANMVRQRQRVASKFNSFDVTFIALGKTFDSMQTAVRSNQLNLSVGIKGFFIAFRDQLRAATAEVEAVSGKVGLFGLIGKFFTKVGNFFKKLPYDAEHAQKVGSINAKVNDLKQKREQAARMPASTSGAIARRNQVLASLDQRIQRSQQANTPALAHAQGLSRTFSNLDDQKRQSDILRRERGEVLRRKPQTPQDIAATVSELARLNAAIEAGDQKIAKYERRINGVTASAGTMGDNLRRAALKVALAWERGGDTIQNKVLRGLVKFSAPIGKKLVDLLNHNAADTVAAAWERTEHSTKENMQQMAHNADVAGAQIVENLGGAAQQVAQQAAHPPAEGAAAQAQRRMGILGHAGNVAKKGWKAGAAIGGAGMAAGFAGQGAVYSLSTLGVIDEEQTKASDKFFQLFTLLSSITGLITPIAGAVAATFEAVVGAAMGAWAAISGLVAGLGALFTNPVTGFVGAVALALLVANWALKKFFNVDLGQYVTQFGMWMWGYISKFGEWVAQPFIWAANAIKGAFSSAWKWVHDNLSEQIDPIISFMRPITDFMDKAVKQITGAWDGFVGRFQSMPLVESAKETATGLINALNHNPTEKIPNAWDGAADRIVNTLGSLPPEAQTTANQMNAAIIDSLGNISPEAQNMAKQVNAALGTMTPEQKKKMLADGMQSLASPFAKKDATSTAVAAAAPTTQIGQLSQSVTELKDPTKDLKQAAMKLKISATELKIAVTMMSLAKSPFQLIESYKKAMANPAAAAATTATSVATSVAQSTAYNRITGRPMPTATPLEAAQNAARLQQIENEKKGIARKEAMVKAFQTAQASATVALSNPITQAVLGVTAIIALVEALTPKFNLLGNLAAIIVAPFTFLKGIVGGLMEAFNIVLPPMTLKEDAEKYFQDVKATFLRVSAMIEGAGKNLGKSLGNFLIASTSRIQSAWQGFVDWFSKMPLVQFAKDIATGLINALNHNPTERIPEAWAGAAEKMKEYLGEFLKFAVGAASLIIGAFAFDKLTHKFTARNVGSEFLRPEEQRQERRNEKIRGAIDGIQKFSMYANVANDIAELSGIELPDFVDPLLKATTMLGVFGDLGATVIPALTASLGGLFLPITAVIAAVGLIAIAWSKNLFGIREKTAGAAKWIRGAWQGFVDWFGNMPLVKHALDIATGLINALNHNPTERIPEAWEGAVARIQEGLTGMMTFAQNIGQTLVDAFQGFGTTIQTNFDIATEAIKTTFSGISTSLSEAFTSATTTIQTSLEPLKEAFTGVGTSLSEAITGALTGVQTQFDTLTTSAGEMGTKIKNELTGTLDGVKTWLTDGVAGIFNFGQKPGATPEQYGPQLPPAAKPTESGFDFGKAWSDASSWASDQWPFKAQPEMLGPQLPPAPKAPGEEFDFNKAWSDASSWASQQWPFKAQPEMLGPQLPPAGSANNIVPITLPSSGGSAPIVTASAPVPSETEKLVASLNAIRANPVNPIDDAGKTLAQIATQLTPANKADELKAELAQVQAQATATQVQVVTSAQQLEQDKKKAERWFAGADAKEQAKISEGTTLDLAQAFGAIDEKRLSLVAQLQEIKPRKRFFEDQGRERATEREAAKLGVKANEDKQVVAQTKLIAASLKLEEYRKKAGAGRIAAMRFGGDVVRTEKEVLSLVDAMATLGEQHEALASQVKVGAISGKAADVAKMLGFDPDGLEVVAQSAKASVDKAVGEIQVGWQDRWNYMETVGARGADALFGPGIAEVKNSLKTLGGDFSDFAHRAGTALLKLDWVGFKAAASDFWGNLTFSLSRAASGFGSLAMSAGVFISFTLMHLPLIVVLFGTLAFGAFVLLTNFLGLRTILRGVFEIARGGLEFTIALVDGLLKSLKPINRIVKGLFKALKGDFSEVQAGITDLQYVWGMAFAKMRTALTRMGMGIKRIFQGVFEGIEQVSQPFADFLRKVGTKIEDVVWGFRLFIATIKDGGNAGELFAKLIIGGLKGITHFLWNLPGNLAKALGNMLAGAAEWADKFINKLLSPFNAIGDRIKAALGGEFNFVAFVIEMQIWGARFGEAMLNGLTGSLSLIGKVFGGALDYAGKFITSFGATIASQFPPTLVMAFADVEGTIRTCAANLFAPLVNACKELGNEINRGIREIASGVVVILADVFNFSEFTGKLEGFGARIESTFTETMAVFERFKGAIQDALLAPLNKIEGAWSATFTKIETMAGGLSRILPRFGKKFQGALSEASPGPTYWIRKNWAKTTDFVVSQMSVIQNKAASSGQAISRNLSDTGRTLRSRLTGFGSANRPGRLTAARTPGADDEDKRAKMAQNSRNAMLSVGSVLSNFAPSIASPLFMFNDFIDAFVDLKALAPGFGAAITGAFASISTAAATAWAAVTGPLLPLVIAIGALVVVAGLAYLAFQNNFLGIRDLVGGIWDGIVAVATAVVSVVTGIFGGIWNEVAGVFQTFDKEMKHLWGVVVEMGRLLIEPFLPLIQMFGGKGGGGGSGWLGAAVKGLVSFILLPIKLVGTAISLIIKAIALVVEIAIRLGGVLAFFLLNPMYQIAGVIQGIGSAITWVGQGIWNTLVAPFQFLQNLVADIWSTVSELPNKIGEAVAKVPGGQFMLNVAGRFFGGGGQEPAKYATGGYISGPGSGTADKIPAFLSNGEYVINAAATAQNLGLLEALNSGAGIVPMQVLPMLPPVAIPQIMPVASAPAEPAQKEQMPPIEININLNGNIVLGGANTAEQAQEFLAKLDPYLRQSIHAYLRDAVDFSR